MELRHLRHFVAVAEELSFTQAARRLHIGQPPLSQSIRSLEDSIGAQLLERSRRWVRLTDAGRIFLEDARQILALSEGAAQHARQAQDGEIGELRLGFHGSTPFTPLFSRVINAYRKHAPGVRLHLTQMTTMEQMDALRQSRLDLGFVRPPETPPPSDLLLLSLQSLPLAVATPASHRLAQQPSVSLGELADEPFIMFTRDQGTTLYPQILRLCAGAGFTPRIAMEVREAGTILGLVAADCGIAILPRMFACIDIRNLAWLALDEPQARTELMLAYRKSNASPQVAAFAQIAKAMNASADAAGAAG